MEWQDALVFVAEDLVFASSDLQRRLCDRLLELADRARQRSAAGADRVAWSALRRAGSLLQAEDVMRLFPFLERKGAIDTRMVVLQALARIFEAAPPPDILNLGAIKDRVAEFARKFLDPDVFAAGENAAIALTASFALATLGDHRIVEIVTLIRNLRREWLASQIKADFERLLTLWKANGTAIYTHSAFQLVSNQLRLLQ